MARKINVKLIMELRDAKLSRSTIASTRHISRHSVSAFCGAQRTPMRFRADAMRNITDTPKRLIFCLVPRLDHYCVVLCCPLEYRIG